nr:MAG TPA: hypothetical protein [Caudoviricetes sp.]
MDFRHTVVKRKKGNIMAEELQVNEQTDDANQDDLGF